MLGDGGASTVILISRWESMSGIQKAGDVTE